MLCVNILFCTYETYARNFPGRAHYRQVTAFFFLFLFLQISAIDQGYALTGCSEATNTNTAKCVRFFIGWLVHCDICS